MATTTNQMDLLTREGLKAMGLQTGPCVSILLPLHANGTDRRQDVVRLKTAIQHAEQELKGLALPPAQVASLMEPLHQLVSDESVLGSHSNGVALYRSPELMQRFDLPTAPVDEMINVGDHFYIRPLLPLLNGPKSFYILALSQKHTRLLKCTDHSSEEVALPAGFPVNLMEFNQTRKPDHNLQNRNTAGQVGSMRGVHSGTNTDADNKDEYLIHFFREMDKQLHDLLRHEEAPLLAAGVEYELAFYQRANTYAHFVPEGVHGSPDGLKGGEMHKRALEILAKHRSDGAEHALALLNRAPGDKVAYQVSDVLKAAQEGRVAQLFLAESGPADTGEDGTNDAAMQTFLHGGTVHSLPREKMPSGGAVAAILRY